MFRDRSGNINWTLILVCVLAFLVGWFSPVAVEFHWISK